ncbi:MAG: GTPase ObgE [Candidatus Nanopelagicales bacterium]
MFVDKVVIFAKAGNGGNGCTSVLREKFKPLGGPDGGDGGKGGDVIVKVDLDVNSLLEFHRYPHQNAANGKPGMGGHRAGANGEDLVLNVPNGTVIKNNKGEVIVDLIGVGTEYVIAQGGRGGLGNASLASTKRKAPGFALLGEEGEQQEVQLELKSLADVALVGFPSSGKSSLISVISAAKPKIADYPFTTLVPNLGVVKAGDTSFTVADVPGLIPGASEGKGLGLDFLRHIERCSVIAHVIDCATLEPNRDPLSDLTAIEKELANYSDFNDRTRVVVLNKTDIPPAKELANLVKPDLEAMGYEVFVISTLTKEGISALTYALAEKVNNYRANLPTVESTRIVLKPKAVDEVTFEVSFDGIRYWVKGEKIFRWVKQTDFSNDEAVGYLADRLARAGVEEELLRQGAKAGSEVAIGEGKDAVLFDWQPTIEAGKAATKGPRGSDIRLDYR